MPPHGGPRPTNRSLNWVWDINTLQWVMMTQPLISGGTITVVGVATETNQTNGNQKTQIVDAGGEVATITGGRLDVNSNGLTDAELRATPVPVSGPLTNTELRAAPVVITGAVVTL